jgi:4'-phosphopantetheinyl transferase
VLGTDEVQVWVARSAAMDDARRRAAAVSILAPDELARVGRFCFEKDRRLALASRALVRRVLSRCAAVTPDEWRFTTNAFGRPEIAAPLVTPRLRFSASNTDGLVMCAVVEQRDVGVDVERHRPRAPLEIAATRFAVAERAALLALPRSEQSRRFVELWTVKEAYIKARGRGMSLALDSFCVHISADTPPRVDIDVSLDDPASWQLALWYPTPGHCAAVCVRRHDGSDLSVTTCWDDE